MNPDDINESNYEISASVTAVVVTYNRKALLEECLSAILAQAYSVNKLLIIDNASTDGTRQMLKDKGFLDLPQVSYYRMKKNMGGSGGFYEGIKLARREGCDWVWLMDDDTVPKPDCLMQLLNAEQIIKNRDKDRKISFLTSTVYGPNDEYMNVPAVSTHSSDNGYPYWYEFLDQGIVTIENATFVSILINSKAVERCGLPCLNYFIWGDDVEYTRRLTTYYGDAFLVGNSMAVHKRASAKSIEMENETDPKRIAMYHYFYRNMMINRHYYGDTYRGDLIETIKVFINAAKYLRMKPYGLLYAKTYIKGNLEGILQYRKFRDYIDRQLKSGETSQ